MTDYILDSTAGAWPQYVKFTTGTYPHIWVFPSDVLSVTFIPGFVVHVYGLMLLDERMAVCYFLPYTRLVHCETIHRMSNVIVIALLASWSSEDFEHFITSYNLKVHVCIQKYIYMSIGKYIVSG